MRHWNIETKEELKVSEKKFLPYLWGIETFFCQVFFHVLVWVFTLPMRHWNRWMGKWLGSAESGVFTLPMRHWNGTFGIEVSKSFAVFTLPMRHWNKKCLLTPIVKKMRFLPYLWGIETIIFKFSVIVSITFLPYLWGIETFYFTCWTFKTKCVFTLPMRHWNIQHR